MRADKDTILYFSIIILVVVSSYTCKYLPTKLLTYRKERIPIRKMFLFKLKINIFFYFLVMQMNVFFFKIGVWTWSHGPNLLLRQLSNTLSYTLLYYTGVAARKKDTI